MKKNIILIIASLFLFTDCNKELDIAQQGKLNANTFFQTEADFESAILSPYSTLLNYYYNQFGVGLYKFNLLPDDDVVIANNGTDQLDDFLWQTTDGTIIDVWGTTYKGIQRANLILDRLPVATGFKDVSKKGFYEGEAKFLRAYFNFILAANWGTPPIQDKFIDDITKIKVANSAPGEIWDLIISDLKTAEANLNDPYDPTSPNLGRVNKYSAMALLGKVYLYKAQWFSTNSSADYQNAITEFNKVVASGKFNLTTNYGDNFSSSTENNSESLFEVQFSSTGGFNNWLPVDFNVNSGAATGREVVFRASCAFDPKNCAPGANGSGYGIFQMTPKIQSEFEVLDPRRPQSIFRKGDPYFGTPFDSAWSSTGSSPAKYVAQEFSVVLNHPNNSPDNERIIRYSDVLLMLAEAKLFGPGDIASTTSLINQIRHRADPTDLILKPIPAGLTVDALFKRLQHERRIEFVLEGHRYDDLVRWHRAGKINIKTDIDFGKASSNTNWSEKYLLKPFPQRERELNPDLAQNPGY